MEENTDLITDIERVERLQNILIGRATHTSDVLDEGNYKQLRLYFISKTETKDLLPSWVRVNRTLEQFWDFIKLKYSDYASRRTFIWSEFSSLLQYLESTTTSPAEESINKSLEHFDSEGIQKIWSRALERKAQDPEGAITIARTLLESTCKHILDEKHIQYDSDKIELHALYKKTSTALNLAPNQHTEVIFKQILGGCSAVVNGLGTLRNRLGDAHGKGKGAIKPKSRHAELAVNLSGATALFLVETFTEQKDPFEICYSCKQEFPTSSLTPCDGDTWLCSECAMKIIE